MNDYYILDGHEPVKVNGMMEWALWYETADRRVRHSMLKDGVTVSTVFLGLDHSWGEGPPLIFETMAFGLDEEICERCSTWEQAEAQHEEVVASLLNRKAS